jgi:protein-S-isoprenylcysteine O-methyltransferase Ste14
MTLLANSLWALILLVPVIPIMQRLVICPEKDHLARAFGEQYEHDTWNVRRWL